MDDFLEVKFEVTPEQSEIVIALLSGHEFDSFQLTDDGFSAFIQQSNFNENDFEVLLEGLNLSNLAYSIGEIENKNWNEEWEKNYDPVLVENKVYIRASFHKPRNEIEHQIVINPKMAFGTGHHDTTYLMVQALLNMKLKGHSVLDAGTGTGVLAIVAKRLGAQKVVAYDNSPLATENTIENLTKNNVNGVDVRLGTIDEIIETEEYFDTVFANINRNVLLDELPAYFSVLTKSRGALLVSGFFEHDEKLIHAKAEEIALNLRERYRRNNWSALLYTIE
jgi:ribosomal protein L11 methyltransferase